MLNNCFKQFTTRHDEHIMDRFIPSGASSSAYWAPSSVNQQGSQLVRRMGIPAVRDESLLNLNQTQPNEGSIAFGAIPQAENQRDPIATALNFLPQNRVLTFSPTSNHSRVRSNHSNSGIKTAGNSDPFNSSSSNSPYSMSSSHNSPIFSMISSDETTAIPSRTSMDSDSSFGSSPKSKKTVKSFVPYRVLDAPCLRNDFYTNLVSWSKATNRVAVGLLTDVYLWTNEEGAYLLELPEHDLVSCVSFSDGDVLVIGSKTGRLSLISQELQIVIFEYSTRSKSGICCITWAPGSETIFFAGDESGDVSIFEIQEDTRLVLVKQMRCHNQQVCGMALSEDMKQLAVGGNDNFCTIWDIEDIQNPKMKFALPHQAAVKAVAFCPWSKSLLATGGGSKDKHIRFWHTNSGTLLDAIQTQGQITSLLWSTRKKQIVATFGFGESFNPPIITVYAYPKMTPLVQVNGSLELRVLSAVLSPDSSAICVAANDQTVRFYEIWSPQDSIIKESQEDGVFGSDLIELCEGITKTGGSIR